MKDFKEGVIAGLPIGLGYLSVSMGFGIMAVRVGLTVLQAVGISLTNLTSAGQVAGVSVIAASGTLIEMALTQLVINLRYSLMAVSLTQKTSENFNTFHRIICSFGITDEIFAVASTRDKEVTPSYFYGLMLLPIIGWSGGTLLGGLAGEFFPSSISNAMGIMIYGMFIAVVLPTAKKEKSIVFTAVAAIGLSVLFKYVLTFVPAGISIIICAVVVSAVSALIFPIEDKEGD